MTDVSPHDLKSRSEEEELDVRMVSPVRLSGGVSEESRCANLEVGHDGAPEPRFPGVGVIALVPDRWSAFWQPRHFVLSMLTRYFRVAWVEPALEWRTIIASRGEEHSDAPQPPRGLTVHEAEHLLPRIFRSHWLGDLMAAHRVRRVRRHLRRAGCRHIVLYVWRPDLAAALHRLPFSLTVYHVDDDYAFTDDDLPTAAMEREIIQRVDQVFIHSPALLEKKGGLNPRTAVIPNGVDFARFSRPVPEPADLAAVPHPRIGYMGYLKRQLDWPLLLALAERHADWSFVFVGAQSPHVELREPIQALARLSNVHFLGGRPSHLLGAYPQHFDVCLMPYRVTGYTKYIYPLKLHEYLAGGRPVIGTRIRSLEMFPHVVTLAEGLDGWSAAIAAALEAEANAPERRRLRQMTAAAHDWQHLVRGIADVILARLCERGIQFT